ncbi:REX3 [Candida pseudojiufengensis]|uniref:REX3 n=1 Tax=Candida pseudojiufengensis TaxID=497109 RepID=UPI0022247867|nr:REX3 [Candida pseudojiufengensis]KAI5966784.1 REX3 [Candida pseudojiufengensis]
MPFDKLKNIDGKFVKSPNNQKRPLRSDEPIQEKKLKTSPSEITESIDVKHILPKSVSTAPATIPERKKYIERIASIMLKINPSIATPNLKAIEFEYEIAKSSTTRTYASTLRNAVYKLEHPEKFDKVKNKPTLSSAEELKALRSLIIPVSKLSKYGYIMTPPTSKPNESLTRICSRCGTEFKLSQQLEKTKCFFHHGKIRRKIETKSRYFDCCMAPPDSQTPCDSSEHHVFQITSPEEKQSILPYKYTSDLFKSKGKYEVLGIDCEMGFTTKGFELMRITAVDYFTLKTVLDIYVLPFGEVVDLNTRYSGISKIDDKFMSYDQSMKKLGAIMGKDTILIGHGLENDMNTMRLIHNNIIDTSILYPKFETSPTFRLSLKDLAFKYLSKNIQVGEHDSAEDSIAAIEIVKFHINKKL